ncbi:MAG: hypothetical protein K5871_00865 [Lachnospiraceae bacterium]|nr:hypothetical protein [Lachnospiraceae bacterium]
MSSNNKRARLFSVLFFAFCISSVSVFSGCSEVAEEDNMVILFDEESVTEVAGNLPAEYADVVSTMNVSCRYRTAVTQDLSFDIERAKISTVYVAAGETVRRGQLLISIETNTDIEAERAEILYQIQRIELQRERTLAQKEYEITLATFNNAMNGDPMSPESRNDLEKKLQEIEDKYYFTLQGYEDSILIANLKLQNLEANNVDHNIYAGMDGIVEYLREGLEGSQTVIGRTVITLKDPNDMYFYASDPSLASYLEEGQTVTISVSGSQGGEYEAVPELSDDGTSLRFILTGDDAATVSIAEGTSGNIVLELGRRDNVLSVPAAAVHRAGDITYVYVVDDDGYRRYKEVVVGLEGDDRTEIISGLEAGDMVAVNF